MKTENLFNRHLIENRMTYFEHLWFAFMLARKTFGCAMASMIHAIFPFLFVYHTSTTVFYLNDIFIRRTKKLNELEKSETFIIEKQNFSNLKNIPEYGTKCNSN